MFVPLASFFFLFSFFPFSFFPFFLFSFFPFFISSQHWEQMVRERLDASLSFTPNGTTSARGDLFPDNAFEVHSLFFFHTFTTQIIIIIINK